MREKTSKQCAHHWERRTPGKRYVNNRGRCRRMTAHPSGYCSEHRFPYRWTPEMQAAYQRMKDAEAKQA